MTDKEYMHEYYIQHREVMKARAAAWLKDNPERAKKRRVEYRAGHLDQEKVRHAAYYKEHKAERDAKNALWRQEHPEVLIAEHAAHYQEHKTEIIAQSVLWAKEHPERRKEIRAASKRKHPETNLRGKAKRRALGFVPLNLPFPDCEGHHIDQEHVIYIPREMHRSISHNVWTGRNMSDINALARAFLVEDLQ